MLNDIDKRREEEIIKEIEDLEMGIRADEELGCGFAPPGAYDKIYERINELENELAKLKGYENSYEMMMAEMEQPDDEEVFELASMF